MHGYSDIMYEVVELLRQYGAYLETHDEEGNLINKEEDILTSLLDN
jgi:hypothetical protein